MRYQVGQELIAVYFQFLTKKPGVMFATPYTLNEFSNVKSIWLRKFEVKEFHEVSCGRDVQGEKKEGYILKDDCDRIYYNQYPIAIYEPTWPEEDYLFARHFESEENQRTECQNPVEPMEYKLLTEVYKDLHNRANHYLPFIEKLHILYERRLKLKEKQEAIKQLMENLSKKLLDEFKLKIEIINPYPDRPEIIDIRLVGV